MEEDVCYQRFSPRAEPPKVGQCERCGKPFRREGLNRCDCQGITHFISNRRLTSLTGTCPIHNNAVTVTLGDAESKPIKPLSYDVDQALKNHPHIVRRNKSTKSPLTLPILLGGGAAVLALTPLAGALGLLWASLLGALASLLALSSLIQFPLWLALLMALYAGLALLLDWPLRLLARAAKAAQTRRAVRHFGAVIFAVGFACGMIAAQFLSSTGAAIRALATASAVSVVIAAILFYAIKEVVPFVFGERARIDLNGGSNPLLPGAVLAFTLAVGTVTTLAMLPALLGMLGLDPLLPEAQIAAGLVINVVGDVLIMLLDKVLATIWKPGKTLESSMLTKS